MAAVLPLCLLLVLLLAIPLLLLLRSRRSPPDRFPPGPWALPVIGHLLGFDVPEGAMVIVNAWAIGMNPAHWDAPEEFVPERFEQNGRDFRGADFEFVPFGAGRRICPGMAFGLAHVEVTLAALLFHFDWELPGGMAAEGLDMTEQFGVTTSLRSDLVVVAVPRVPVTTESHMITS